LAMRPSPFKGEDRRGMGDREAIPIPTPTRLRQGYGGQALPLKGRESSQCF
jgi:hypothetical protein